MKIYTKTGDKGLTSLLGGTRVFKSHLRIEAYGTVDELNSVIGLLASLHEISKSSQNILIKIQHTLFTIGSVLACETDKAYARIPHLKVTESKLLEREIDDIDKKLPSLKAFILPGGHFAVAHCHVARCICRRAERYVVKLAQDQMVPEEIIIYLNRLSDYLFMLARNTSFELGIEDVPWESVQED
jgi:cob(I)alamin adenosyltransferase